MSKPTTNVPRWCARSSVGRRGRRGRFRTVALVAALGLAGVACGSSASGDARGADFPDPTFEYVGLGDVVVEVDGEPVRVADSPVRYQRGNVDDFDDPSTDGHDGVHDRIQAYRRCEAGRWSIGVQTLTVDVIEAGIHRGDASLVERGAAGVDWGVGLPLGSDGVHSLHRVCDGQTLADYGGTHHSTQWLVELSRAVYLLRAVPGGEDGVRIARAVERVEELATRLVGPANTAAWEEQWLFDDAGEIFTHKTYMRAAALQLAASLTDDADAAGRWAAEAERIARRGLSAQWDDGVNPERGGYDVRYQMYGTWLAQVYLSVLPEEADVRADIETMVDGSIRWIASRTDSRTGRVDVGESTRTCIRNDGTAPAFDSELQVRVLLHRAQTRADSDHLAEIAVAVDAYTAATDDPCPRS